jgi:phospholipid/cholesterol/gamma-HCH transport system substrate-binding protein
MSDRGTPGGTERGRPEDDRDEDLPPIPPARGADKAAWVGLFLVVGLVATLGALFILTDAAIFRGRYVIATNVPDAGGIRRGDPVQMRGVNIGRVQRFTISQQGVEIRLEIEGEYEIPKDSYVQLSSAGLLGGMIADIVPGQSKEMIRYGATLPGRTEAALSDATNRLAEQAETALNRVNSLLSPDTISNVHGSSAEMRSLLVQLSATVREQRREMAGLTASLRRASTGLERTANAPEIDRSVKRLDALTQRMDVVTAALDRSAQGMETVVGRVQRGEGTLGKLTQDETLYNNLNTASKNLNDTILEARKVTQEAQKLMLEIQKDPRRYFKFSVF